MMLRSVPLASIMETERSPWCPPAYPSSTPRASKNWLCPNHNPTLNPPTPRQPPRLPKPTRHQGRHHPNCSPSPHLRCRTLQSMHHSPPPANANLPQINQPPLNLFHPFWIGTHPQTPTNSPFCPAGTVTNQTPMVNIRPIQNSNRKSSSTSTQSSASKSPDSDYSPNTPPHTPAFYSTQQLTPTPLTPSPSPSQPVPSLSITEQSITDPSDTIIRGRHHTTVVPRDQIAAQLPLNDEERQLLELFRAAKHK